MHQNMDSGYLWVLELKKMSIFFFICPFSFDGHVLCNWHFKVRKKNVAKENKKESLVLTSDWSQEA